MAIDTQEKRMSAIGNGLPWMARPLPTGTIDAEERLSILGLYSGNAVAAPAAGVVPLFAPDPSNLPNRYHRPSWSHPRTFTHERWRDRDSMRRDRVASYAGIRFFESNGTVFRTSEIDGLRAEAPTGSELQARAKALPTTSGLIYAFSSKEPKLNEELRRLARLVDANATRIATVEREIQPSPDPGPEIQPLNPQWVVRFWRVHVEIREQGVYIWEIDLGQHNMGVLFPFPIANVNTGSWTYSTDFMEFRTEPRVTVQLIGDMTPWSAGGEFCENPPPNPIMLSWILGGQPGQPTLDPSLFGKPLFFRNSVRTLIRVRVPIHLLEREDVACYQGLWWGTYLRMDWNQFADCCSDV